MTEASPAATDPTSEPTRLPVSDASATEPVTVPESDKEVMVKVTLQAENSTMEWVYVTYPCGVDISRVQKVTLELPDDRNYVCMIYLDGVLDKRIEMEGV